MEGEKSHNALSASCKAPESQGWNCVWVWRPENLGSQWGTLSLRWKTWEGGACPESEAGIPVSAGRRRWISQFKKREKCAISPPFYSLWTEIGEGGSSFFTLLISMLNSSRNMVPDTPRNIALLAIWAWLIPFKLTLKISHHYHYKSCSI